MNELFKTWIESMKYDTPVTLLGTAMAITLIGTIVCLIIGIAQNI